MMSYSYNPENRLTEEQIAAAVADLPEHTYLELAKCSDVMPTKTTRFLVSALLRQQDPSDATAAQLSGYTKYLRDRFDQLNMTEHNTLVFRHGHWRMDSLSGHLAYVVELPTFAHYVAELAA